MNKTTELTFEHVKENVLYINEDHQLKCPHCKEYNIFPIKIENYADKDSVYGSRQWFACELCPGISIFQTEFYKGNIYVAMNKAFAFRPSRSRPSPSVEVS